MKFETSKFHPNLSKLKTDGHNLVSMYHPHESSHPTELYNSPFHQFT